MSILPTYFGKWEILTSFCRVYGCLLMTPVPRSKIWTRAMNNFMSLNRFLNRLTFLIFLFEKKEGHLYIMYFRWLSFSNTATIPKVYSGATMAAIAHRSKASFIVFMFLLSNDGILADRRLHYDNWWWTNRKYFFLTHIWKEIGDIVIYKWWNWWYLTMVPNLTMAQQY